jgi:methanogenic corrinoid protein MtbC1
MDEVVRFEAEEYLVPELLLSARAMKGAAVASAAAGRQRCTAGRVVIGTVKGDLHDVGNNLVASLLEGRGFDTRSGCGCYA